jgi:hypothetical protein
MEFFFVYFPRRGLYLFKGCEQFLWENVHLLKDCSLLNAGCICSRVLNDFLHMACILWRVMNTILDAACAYSRVMNNFLNATRIISTIIWGLRNLLHPKRNNKSYSVLIYDFSWHMSTARCVFTAFTCIVNFHWNTWNFLWPHLIKVFRHKRKHDTIEFSVEKVFQTVVLVLLGVPKQLTRRTISSHSYFLEIPS